MREECKHGIVELVKKDILSKETVKSFCRSNGLSDRAAASTQEKCTLSYVLIAINISLCFLLASDGWLRKKHLPLQEKR